MDLAALADVGLQTDMDGHNVSISDLCQTRAFVNIPENVSFGRKFSGVQPNRP
jgi:hypothetical protein